MIGVKNLHNQKSLWLCYKSCVHVGKVMGHVNWHAQNLKGGGWFSRWSADGILILDSAQSMWRSWHTSHCMVKAGGGVEFLGINAFNHDQYKIYQPEVKGMWILTFIFQRGPCSSIYRYIVTLYVLYRVLFNHLWCLLTASTLMFKSSVECDDCLQFLSTRLECFVSCGGGGEWDLVMDFCWKCVVSPIYCWWHFVHLKIYTRLLLLQSTFCLTMFYLPVMWLVTCSTLSNFGYGITLFSGNSGECILGLSPRVWEFLLG